MNPALSAPNDSHSRQSGPSWTRRFSRLAVPALAALGMLAPQVRAGALYLDFAANSSATTTGWTPFYLSNAPGVSNVGGSGYGFSFTNVGAYGNSTTQTLTGSGFHNGNNYVTNKIFTLSGLNPNKPVKLYACAAWDAGRGAYLVYGDTGPAGVKAVTVGDPGTTGSLANMTLIGTATADAGGSVSGQMYGNNGVPGTSEGQLGGFVFIPTQIITASAGSNGTISSPGATDVYAGESPVYTITANSGYHVADVLVDGVSVGAVGSYTFTNLAANHTIEATFALDGVSHTITASAGPNGSINPSGAVGAFEGTSKLFTISANAGYHIADVVVDGSSVGPVGTYTFSNISANHTISASFAINTYTVTASAGSNGSISPAGSVSVNHGDALEFAFTPAPGYYVSDILVDGVAVAAVPGPVPSSYVISNITANRTISASFDNRTRVNLDFAGTGNPTTPDWIPVYATQLGDTMVNVPNVGGTGYGFTFDHVATYNNTSRPILSQSGFYNFSGSAYNHPFSLTGLIPGQQVSLYACSAWDGNPLGGYIVYGNSGAAGVKAQNVGTMNSTPTLSNLTLIGTATVDGTGKVAGNLYGSAGVASTGGDGQVGGFVFAIEAPPTWTITASAGANGSISPNGPVSVTSGSSQTFAITPNSGYHIADVLVDGVSVGAVGSHTFNTVTANHTISATFAVNTVTYNITASAGANGSISPGGVTNLNAGVNQIYTITPATGYHVADVLVDGVSAGAVGSYTFTGVAADHTISASFAINTFIVNASAGANGSISPSGPAPVNYGDSPTFTITPAEGYFVDDVQVDGLSVGTPSSYTFNNVTANHTISVTFDNRVKLKLDFTNYGGAYTANWTRVEAGMEADTNVNVSNVGGSPYGFTFSHVAVWDNGNALQSLTRSGFYNIGNTANDHTFTLTGLNNGQTVSLYACAGWDGNGAGGHVVFGDSGSSGVKAQTVGNPGTTGTQANLTLIGTATSVGGMVTGTFHGAGGVGTSTEGQLGGFIFAITPGGTPPEPPTAFDNWASSVYGLTGIDAQASSDPDFDGVPNVIEFALGSSPIDGASQGLAFRKMATVSSVPDVLTYTIAVLDDADTQAPPVFTAAANRQTATAQGITYTVEAANDLVDWGGPVVTEVTGEDASNIWAELPIPDTGWTYKTFRTDGSTATDASDFIRLNVK